MPGQQDSDGASKAGTNKGKCKAYRSSGRRELRKIKNVLRSSGPEAALKYASEHDLTGVLRSLRSLKIFKQAIEKSPAFAKFAKGR